MNCFQIDFESDHFVHLFVCLCCFFRWLQLYVKFTIKWLNHVMLYQWVHVQMVEDIIIIHIVLSEVLIELYQLICMYLVSCNTHCCRLSVSIYYVYRFPITFFTLLFVLPRRLFSLVVD